MSETPLWVPSSPETTQLAQFMKNLGHEGADYASFWRWSVDHPEKFWDSVWDFAGIVGKKAILSSKSGAISGKRGFSARTPELRRKSFETASQRARHDLP